MKYIFILASFITLLSFQASAQTKIVTKDATKHIGETVTIYDTVYDAILIEGSEKTLISLGENYPDQLLTVIIKGVDRNKFNGKPELYFKGQHICVTGKVLYYKGKPEIVVSNPSQLKIDLSDNVIL